VEEAESFLKDHIKTKFDDVMFVPYDYPSRKEINLKFGSLSELRNFDYLTSEKSYLLDLKFPTYIEMSNGEVIKFIYLNNENLPYDFFDISENVLDDKK
jgi:hypothetical protein